MLLAFQYLAGAALESLPPWVAVVMSTPDEQWHLNAGQVAVGVGLYLWVSYYLCMFLPYRVLYDEYQSYRRRAAQVQFSHALGHT